MTRPLSELDLIIALPLGYLPLSLIASFHRLQSLTTDVSLIIEALRSSHVVELSPDNVKARTRINPTKWPILTEPNNLVQHNSSGEHATTNSTAAASSSTVNDGDRSNEPSSNASTSSPDKASADTVSKSTSASSPSAADSSN